MDTTQCDTLITFFDEYAEHYRHLLTFEREKLQFVMHDDIAALDVSLSREQALMMKGNALEKRRERMLADMGAAGLNFSALEEAVPAERRKDIHACHIRISNLVTETKRVNEHLMDLVNKKLKLLEKDFHGTDGDKRPDVYTGKGEKKPRQIQPLLMRDV